VSAIRTTLPRLVVVAFVYWLAARASLSLALVHGQVTPIWPPTGIALVAVLIFGRSTAIGIFVGALAVNLPIGPTPISAVLIAAGNTLAPVAAAELLNRIGFRRELDRLRDAAAIIVLAALVAMTLSATVGTSVLVISGTVSLSNFWTTWAVWWTGDAMGVMLVAPFLLSLVPRSTAPALTFATGAQLVALLVGIAVVTYVLFESPLRLEYLVFPLIMVAAWRFRLRGATPAALIASGLAVASAVQGIGPFANEDLLEKMITLQVFNVFVAMSSFVLSAYVDARERAASSRRMYEAAQAANRAKGEFLNMAAHELRTPITVLSGYLSMLGEGSLGAPPPAWETPISILADKTAELDKIVGDLLEASRIDINQHRATMGVVDLRQVVTAAVARLGARAKLLSADVSTELPEEPMMVEGNDGQLGQPAQQCAHLHATPARGRHQGVAGRQQGSGAHRRQRHWHPQEPARAGLRAVLPKPGPDDGQGARCWARALYQPRAGREPWGQAGGRKERCQDGHGLRDIPAPRRLSEPRFLGLS